MANHDLTPLVSVYENNNFHAAEHLSIMNDLYLLLYYLCWGCYWCDFNKWSLFCNIKAVIDFSVKSAFNIWEYLLDTRKCYIIQDNHNNHDVGSSCSQLGSDFPLFMVTKHFRLRFMTHNICHNYKILTQIHHLHPTFKNSQQIQTSQGWHVSRSYHL